MKSTTLATALAVLLVPAIGSATPHANPFSYPYQTLAEGALEIEQYTDLTPVRVQREKDDGTLEGVFGVRAALLTEIEYGLTDRLEVGWYFAFNQGASGGDSALTFDGVKQRLRYRFADTGELPVDIGLYLEVAELHDEIEFEEKILLAKQIGSLNLVANLWVEQEYKFQDKVTEHLFNPTVGFNYELSPRYIIGAEYWARGEFEHAGEAVHYAGPTFLFQRDKISFALGIYSRLDALGKSAIVDDPYGKLYARAIVAVDL